MRIEWIDSVFSTAYQTANVIANSTAKIGVVTVVGTPCQSVRLSVSRVPNTLMSTTESQ